MFREMTLFSRAPSPEAVESRTHISAEEAALVRDAAAGNTRAFEALVGQHSRRVFNFLYQMTRHRQDAEDLTQRTFIKAYQNLARFDPQRPWINWLLTIARRTALNHFRDTKRWEEIPESSESAEPSPARNAEIQDRTDNIWSRARDVLSQREFEVIWLRFAEELSTEETAQATGLTVSNVKVIVFRARQQLLKGDNRHEE
jgi:RNA polymerase sigma-70 factor (ECF subfamily)